MVLLGARVFLHLDFPEYFFKKSRTGAKTSATNSTRLSSSASVPTQLNITGTNLQNEHATRKVPKVRTAQKAKQHRFKQSRAFSSCDSVSESDVER